MKQKLMRIMTLIFVVALVFVMACPVFASTNNIDLTGSQWTIPMNTSIPEALGVFNVEGYLSGSKMNKLYLGYKTDYAGTFPVKQNGVACGNDGNGDWYSTNAVNVILYISGGSDVTNTDLLNFLLTTAVWDKGGSFGTDDGFPPEVDVSPDIGGLPDADIYTVSGVYRLVQPFTLEGFDFDVTFDTPVKLYSGDQTYTEYSSISKLDDNQFLRFYGNTGNGNSGVTGETCIGIKSETVTYIDFGSTPQEVSEDFSNWLGGNASFFRQVPSLTQVVSSSALEMVMTEVVAILPVGITCLVGYLALRKALRVLERVLYQA